MRKKRELSRTGYYHAILRGVGRNLIFCNEVDKRYFAELLKRYSLKLNVKVAAYALLDNHVHLLLRETPDDFTISEFVKRVCISYTQQYFNKTYDHVGSLFQNRFVSRPIKDGYDLATVTRYLAYNPVRAGLGTYEQYEYSSYKTLLADFKAGADSGFLFTDDIRAAFGCEKNCTEFMQLYSCYEADAEDYTVDNKEVAAETEKIKAMIGVGGQFFAGNEEIRRIFIYLLERKVSMARIARVSGMPLKVIKSHCR